MQMYADLHVLDASLKASALHTGALFDTLQPEGGFKVSVTHNKKDGSWKGGSLSESEIRWFRL